MIQVEAIERATLGAVAPREVVELGGWLVALEPGTIRRAKSAVPLSHDATFSPALLDDIEATFAERGLEPAFRLGDAPGLEPVRSELARRGYQFEQPTLVKVGSAQAMIAAARGAAGDVSLSPDDDWAEVFLSPGFDPADGAQRVAALMRSADAVYGVVREGGKPVAVGVAAFGAGWASVHGMRTDANHRGQGLAGRVLVGLAGAAQARGIDRVFLQVEEANLAARSLYRGFGFTAAWRYFYWSRPL